MHVEHQNYEIYYNTNIECGAPILCKKEKIYQIMGIIWLYELNLHVVEMAIVGWWIIRIVKPKREWIVRHCWKWRKRGLFEIIHIRWWWFPSHLLGHSIDSLTWEALRSPLVSIAWLELYVSIVDSVGYFSR